MRWRGSFLLLALAVTVSACTTTSGTSRRAAASWTAPLAGVGIDGTMQDLAYPKDYYVRQISSADPAGGIAAASFSAGAFQGGTLLADLTGPGTILRIYAESPSGMLGVFIDGQETPSIYLPFDALFGQQYPAFGTHLTGRNDNGGYFWYVPIPYKVSCQVVAFDTREGLIYQITYADLHPATPVESFHPALTRDERRYFTGWNKAWEEASKTRFVRRSEERFHKSSRTLYPQKDVLILPMDGPATITELQMGIGSVDPLILEKLWLTIYFDGETDPSVLAPVGAFFGTGNPGPPDYGGLALGNINGLMWCRFPMPFLRSAEIRLVNTSDQAIDFYYDITWRPGPIDRQLRFFARYNEAVTDPGEPYTVAAIRGAGHFVGCTATMTAGRSFEYLRGGETIMVDGLPAGSYRGTGADHYFNTGRYAPGGASSFATHAVTGKDPDTYSFTAHRSHIVDAIPFSESFVFQLKHGARNDHPGMDYSSVAYWYQMRPYSELWPVRALEWPDGTGRVAGRTR
jgi:hypothetical protein